LGSGAREHALAWKFSKSKRITGLYIAPGNGGTSEVGENIPDADITEPNGLIKICADNRINLVFVGPEAPLAAGIADDLEASGIPVIGPKKEAARLESSKTYSKDFMVRHGIPTAEAKEFESEAPFVDYIGTIEGKAVIKKSGLASGKGVFESADRSALEDFGKKILTGDKLLVEEFLEGYEISIFALFDGKSYLLFPPCADFKKAGENDTGPNTGGMGAICPVPGVGSRLMGEIERTIIEPTFRGIREDGLDYSGFLYFGLMITSEGPKLLEYNVRLGDPEAQVLLPLIDSDFCNLMEAVSDRKLDSFPLRISGKSAVGIVVASGGYPGEYKKDVPVEPLPVYSHGKRLIFHAATAINEEGDIVTGGGRCFTAVGVKEEILDARRAAYEAAEQIRFPGSWFRRDIGDKFLF
jgi:phosphoribosylamine--glycine ligase